MAEAPKRCRNDMAEVAKNKCVVNMAEEPKKF